MRFIGLIIAVCLLPSCSETSSHPLADTLPVSPADNDSVRSNIGFAALTSELHELNIPSFLKFDSLESYTLVDVSGMEYWHYFPEQMSMPSNPFVSAFAKQKIDSATTGIWYWIDSKSANSPVLSELYLVLYQHDSIPVDVHCFARSGINYGFAKIDSVASWREVFVVHGEKTIVTTKSVKTANGHFLLSDEQTSTFGVGHEVNSRAFIDEFFE